MFGGIAWSILRDRHALLFQHMQLKYLRITEVDKVSVVRLEVHEANDLVLKCKMVPAQYRD